MCPLRTKIVENRHRIMALLIVIIATVLLYRVDLAIVVFISGHRNGLLDKFFYYYTTYGNYLFALFEGCFLLIFYRDRRMYRYNVAILISFGSWLVADRLTVALKYLFRRPRPYVANPEIPVICRKPNDYSFPSGHSSSAFSLTTPLILECRSKWLRLSLIFFAVLMCFSRIYCGVHYPSDVVFGAFIGWVSADTVYGLFVRQKNHSEN